MDSKRSIAIFLLFILLGYISVLFRKKDLFFQRSILSEITVPTITITNDNQFDIITQTGEALLYRNEVYGFELHLWPETKGLKIREKQKKWERWSMINFYAKLPYLPNEEIVQSEMPLSKDFPGWDAVFAVYIVNPKEYDKWLNTERFWTTMKEMVEEDTLGYHDWLYFVQRNLTNVDHAELSQTITWLQCNEDLEFWDDLSLDCWNWLDRMIKQRFSFIKRSFKKHKNDQFS